MVQINKDELYDRIIDTLEESLDDGYCSMGEEIKLNDTYTLYVSISVSLEMDGYREDDYFNGTGAYITTYVSASVKRFRLEIYNEKTEDFEEPLDCEGWENRIEKDLEDYFRD